MLLDVEVRVFALLPAAVKLLLVTSLWHTVLLRLAQVLLTATKMLLLLVTRLLLLYHRGVVQMLLLLHLLLLLIWLLDRVKLFGQVGSQATRVHVAVWARERVR